MAFASTPLAPANLLDILARPFIAFGNTLIKISESSEMAQKAKRVAEMSDEELTSKGLTREQAIQDIFKAYAHI
ncbi:hypothetical protein N9O61_04555 [Octadecabacter sp.]|nr:hypothetical protein [Octadecabacter sp.]